MSKNESNYVWYNVENTFQIIVSLIDLINRENDLYDPKFGFQDNDGCSFKYSHSIGEFMPMKKQHDFLYGFKFQGKSIHERFSNLEGCLHSRRKNRLKTFSSLENELLPSSKNITLKKDHIIYPVKQKDLCDYDPRFIMSSGLMFDDIIMGIIKNNEFPHPTEEKDFVFTQIDNNIIYMYRESLQDFHWRKGT